MVKGGRNFRPLPPLIGGGERERVGAGPMGWRRMPVSSRTGEQAVSARFPLSRVADVWARGRYLNVVRPGLP
jgi:hypothetical protein